MLTFFASIYVIAKIDEEHNVDQSFSLLDHSYEIRNAYTLRESNRQKSRYIMSVLQHISSILFVCSLFGLLLLTIVSAF